MSKYASHFSILKTPQTEKIPGSKQIKNNAGGFSFQVDDWQRLNRFLILGADNGSYYVKEKELTVQNAECVIRCAQQDLWKTVDTIVQISKAGRAPKNDPAIFALAICAGEAKGIATNIVMKAFPEACRIPTHVFQFVEAVEKFRGHGRSLNTALKNWYLKKEPKDVARLVTKYQSREGWSHRDILRLTRPKVEGDFQTIFHWIVKGWEGVGELPHDREAILPIWAFEKAKRAESKKEIVKLIRDYDLPRECIPTKFLNEPKVWEELLVKMPMTAMIRNLGKMTSIGILDKNTEKGKIVTENLSNLDKIKKSRIHPMNLLIAQKIYEQGHGDKGKLSWIPNTNIIDALDEAFHLAFGNVTPTGKSRLCAIDASGSMNATINGCASLTCRQAAVAMAMVTVASEPNCEVMGFTNADHTFPIPLSKRQRLTDAIRLLEQNVRGSGTDCSLPLTWSSNNNKKFDSVEIYTDSETYSGQQHTVQALSNYRIKYGRCKFPVVSMVANEMTVGDPKDLDTLQVVGFDSSVPEVVNQFISE